MPVCTLPSWLLFSPTSRPSRAFSALLRSPPLSRAPSTRELPSLFRPRLVESRNGHFSLLAVRPSITRIHPRQNPFFFFSIYSDLCKESFYLAEILKFYLSVFMLASTRFRFPPPPLVLVRHPQPNIPSWTTLSAFLSFFVAPQIPFST